MTKPDVQRALPRRLIMAMACAAALMVAANAVPDGHVVGIIDNETLGAWLALGLGAAALWLVLGSIDAGRLGRAARRVAAGLAVSTVTLLVGLIGAEYATRYAFRDVTTTSDNRGYFSDRWLRSGAVVHNSHGFREREFPAQKPAGVYRVAVVGDSFTYGNGLQTDRRFTDVMQRSLPPSIEVLNFGVPGDNTPEHASLLRDRLPRFGPDFVLVQWFVNDVEGARLRGRPSPTPLVPIEALHRWLFTSSALYSLLNAQWAARQVLGQMDGSYAAYMERNFASPQTEASRQDREAMRALVGAARERGVPLGIVLFPDPAYDLGDAYPFAFLHDRVMAFCRENALPCLDLRPAFAQVPDRMSLWVNRLDHHPSARANMVAAVEILKVFEPLWVTP